MRMPHPGDVRDAEKNRRSVTAVPRSGSRAMRMSGTEVSAAGDQQVAGRRRAAAVLAEELGQHQRDADLRELGGLEVEGSQRNPAAGAAGRRAEEQHVDEQRQAGRDR